MMTTLLSYTLFVLSAFLSSLYPVMIIARAGKVKQVVEEVGEEFNTDKSLSIIIPSKNEPLHLVVEKLVSLSSMRCFDEILVVLDDGVDYVHKLVKSIDRGFFDKGFIVARVNSYGGRNGALTDGAKLSLSSNILIIDVDTAPSQDFLCNARRCEDVCVGIWRPYIETHSRVESAMAYITEFGSWVFYELKSMLNLFVYPLGAGTVIDKQLLDNVGYWRVDVIQDDIWLGYELLYKGIKPKVIRSYIEVGVPKTLSATRIQQCRWSYGTSNVLSRFIGKVIRSPLKLYEKIDAVIYTAQPLVSILALASFILTMISSAIDKNIPLDILYLIPVALALLVQGMAMNIYGSKVHRLNLWRKLYLSGRTGAIYTILSPLLGFYALKGLIRAKYRYIITPKILQSRRRILDLSETINLTLAVPSLAMSAINRNKVAMLISLILFIATLYSIIRLEKD
ncbi:MAG: glycosyltransferase family 2 protein [Ignisphaera sp.]|uniref:Glycosyltransferase family 2 protein n=1 Tax=Ignisphaera aggregans TaxID=334771 RepID=A0A7C4JJH4_9CREN